MEPLNTKCATFNETFNLEACLELLIRNSDIDMKIKLISMLSGYLLLNDSNIDKIVTYNPLYDQICQILVTCSTRKAAVTLNFVTALLYVREEDDERRRTLVVYARNMVRSSGCLAAMCEMFASTMMNQDTWRALCRSIAEACRGVEANQSYCTHIVPVCVQRTNIRNIEMLTVLQSLLQNHNTNIKLFIECDGMSLFKRDFLQLDACLQLLATVVETSKCAAELLAPTNVCEQLHCFLNVYGPQSKLGQWATIILYHTSKTTVGHDNNNKPTITATITSTKDMSTDHDIKGDKDISANTTEFFRNVMKEVIQFNSYGQLKPKTPAFFKKVNDNLFNISDSVQRKSLYNKSTKSIIYAQRLNSCGNREKAINLTQIRNLKMNLRQHHEQNKINENVHLYNSARHAIRKYPSQRNKRIDRFSDLSFTFLQNTNICENLSQTLPDRDGTTSPTILNSFKNNTRDSNTNALDFMNFTPKFVSTPKHRYQNSNYLTQTMNTRSEILHPKNTFDETGGNKTVQEIKQRTIGSRFFEAINESCTTIVKTVKSIFSSKNRLHDVKKDSQKSLKNSTQMMNASSCSYSFTEYMRKRDLFLRKDHTRKSQADYDLSVENSCDTCNDTTKLKKKMANDKYLRRTVRKLKLGINLYGCDFKRISRTMWPRDSYMTPSVLYNLYRKLLLK